MEKKKKAPIRHGSAKVPVIMQLEVLECGAACLSMILAYYNKWVPLEQTRIDCGVSRDGSNAKNILLAARNYGMKASGYKYEPEQLKAKGRFPCIIHWNFNHFVVLDGFKKDKAILNDPARGRLEVSWEEFDSAFTGVCIMLEPGDGFVADGHPKSIMQFVKKRLKGAEKAMLFIFMTALLSSVFAIINPLFTKVFIDRLLTGDNQEWVQPFFVVLLAVTAAELILQIIKSIGEYRIEGKLAAAMNAEYMWHILRMPFVFFTQRLAGDLTVRKMGAAQAVSTLVRTLAPLALDVVMMIVYLILLVRYNTPLALIGIGGIFINFFVGRYISTKRMNISRVLLRDQGKMDAVTVSGIEMIETIKSSGAENGFFEKWSGYQASVNTQNVRSIKIDQILGLIPKLVSVIVNMIILWLGLWFIIRGKFTIGMLYTFQSFLSSFLEPVQKVTETGDVLREMKADMERIDDVLEYEVDVPDRGIGINESTIYDKLAGKVEMKNVTFGYSRLAEPLIENFSMTVERGQKVAFVGTSGCGKSTLAKLISGLYSPWSGEILFDGKPLAEIDRNIFTGSLAVVDQDITLFEDTIANNVKMWDTSIEDFEMILAARDASLHEDVMQREDGYYYKMAEGGKDFSGGQRQRIEIARVLAQDPTIMIMDEATSALDARTEFEVVDAIRKRGITSIVIAHRLSTIRDCDEIIVMDRGKIVQRGTHEELMQMHGKYEELIMSE